MNSGQIFQYSEDFLNEIIEELIQLKLHKQSNPKNNEFNNKLRSILGKNLEISEFDNFTKLSDKNLRDEIIQKFKKTREERIKILGEDQSREIEKRIFLQSIDINWKSHIQYLEQLRQVIGLRSYGQRDPLVEYKKEAFDLFESLLKKLKLDFVTILMNLKIVESKNEESSKINKPKKIDPKYIGKKMSRNEPCLCGSGKKYKRCCGAL